MTPLDRETFFAYKNTISRHWLYISDSDELITAYRAHKHSLWYISLWSVLKNITHHLKFFFFFHCKDSASVDVCQWVHFFHRDDFNDPTPFRTHFHVRSYFTKLLSVTNEKKKRCMGYWRKGPHPLLPYHQHLASTSWANIKFEVLLPERPPYIIFFKVLVIDEQIYHINS